MSRSKLIVVVIAMVVVAAGAFYMVGRGPSGADVELGTVTEKATFTSLSLIHI